MTVALALESLGPGATLATVIRATGLPWRAARREWLRLWLAGLAPAPRHAPLPGAPRPPRRPPSRPSVPLTAAERSVLRRLVRDHPDEWATEIASRFAAEAGRPIHKTTAWRYRYEQARRREAVR